MSNGSNGNGNVEVKLNHNGQQGGAPLSPSNIMGGEVPSVHGSKQPTGGRSRKRKGRKCGGQQQNNTKHGGRRHRKSKRSRRQRKSRRGGQQQQQQQQQHQQHQQ
jgi:hypothetical protein